MASKSHNKYGSYNRSSNAYKYPDYGHTPKKKKRIVKKKRMLVYTRIKDRGVRITKETVITFITIFIGCITLIMVHAMISDKKSSIVSLRAELKQQKELNQNLTAESAKDFDEGEIERMASTMKIGKPKSYQIISFNAPKENYELIIPINDIPDTMDTSTWINEVSNYFNKLLKKKDVDK